GRVTSLRRRGRMGEKARNQNDQHQHNDQHEHDPQHGNPPSALRRCYANSNSIFLAVRSRFTIRKLRTCPARTGSALGGPPEPVFHFACNMEVSEERSAFDSFGASAFAGVAAVTLQVAWIPSPSSTRAWLPESSMSRPVTTSPALCSAMYSSRPVGTSCFMPNRI